MVVHKCARFCNNPHFLHKHAVKHIAKYLAITSTYVDLPDLNLWLTTHGVVYRPNIKKSSSVTYIPTFTVDGLK